MRGFLVFSGDDLFPSSRIFGSLGLPGVIFLSLVELYLLSCAPYLGGYGGLLAPLNNPPQEKPACLTPAGAFGVRDRFRRGLPSLRGQLAPKLARTPKPPAGYCRTRARRKPRRLPR